MKSLLLLLLFLLREVVQENWGRGVDKWGCLKRDSVIISKSNWFGSWPLVRSPRRADDPNPACPNMGGAILQRYFQIDNSFMIDFKQKTAKIFKTVSLTTFQNLPFQPNLTFPCQTQRCLPRFLLVVATPHQHCRASNIYIYISRGKEYSKLTN